MVVFCLLPFFVSFVLDLLLGDPYCIPHPICGMGRVISRSEKLVRRVTGTERGLFVGGILLVFFGGGLFFFLYTCLLAAAYRLHPFVGLVSEGLFGMQLLAAGSLRKESYKVYDCLKKGDLSGARTALGMIVGRDTDSLKEDGIIRGAVETVAENFSDGVAAPLFYMAIGGLPLAALYKFINTSDSMVGYRNKEYLFLGKAAAKTDDVVNFLPARISGILLVLSAFLLGLDGPSSLRIFWRDRGLSDSPNAGQTEAAAAGALGISLGGDARYFGQIHKKAVFGEERRPPEKEDILTMHAMLYTASLLAFILFAGLRVLLWKYVYFR